MNDIIYHEPSREDLREMEKKIDILSGSINNLTSIMMYPNTNPPKKKKKKIRTELAEVSGNTVAVALYDDGSNKALEFFVGGSSSCKILVYSFPEELGLPDIADIEFSPYIEHACVTLPTNGNRLYSAFCEVGAKFNAQNFSDREIARLLAGYYIPKINQAPKDMLSVFSGWSENTYKTGELYDWFPRSVQGVIKSIPLSRRYYPDKANYQTEQQYLKDYVFLLNMITKTDTKFLVLTYPFLALFSSLMRDPIPLLNIVAEGPVRYALLYMMQTFERWHPLMHSLNSTPKCICQVLSQARDEIVSFTADITSFMTPYEQKRMRSNVEEILNLIQRIDILPQPFFRTPTVCGIIFSNFAISDSKLITKYVESGDVKAEFMNYANFNYSNNDIPAHIFAIFVAFAERNIEDIKLQIRSVNFSNADEAFEFIFDLLSEMFSEYSIDLEKELKIQNIQKIIESLFDDDNDDIAEVFRTIIRKNIRQIVIVDKRNANYPDEMMMYYNNEYIWIPTKLLTNILKEENLLAYRKKILIRLKELGVLITDSGQTRKLMIAKSRFETVQLKRNFFTRSGELELVELGRGYK